MLLSAPAMAYTSRLLLLFLLWGCSACNTSLNCGTYEQPGTRLNPKLVSLINEELDKEIARMTPTWSPGLIAEAPAHARKWLGEIDHVITHCACNPNNTEKRNKMVYDITLRNGEEIKGVYTGNTCYYQISRPLIMKVVFREGKVSEVFTDGAERKESVDMAMSDVCTFAERIIRHDWDRNPQLYFPPEKTPEQKAKEWE